MEKSTVMVSLGVRDDDVVLGALWSGEGPGAVALRLFAGDEAAGVFLRTSPVGLIGSRGERREKLR